jgi:uncharacterized protein YktB (UPF0637 family)
MQKMQPAYSLRKIKSKYIILEILGHAFESNKARDYLLYSSRNFRRMLTENLQIFEAINKKQVYVRLDVDDDNFKEDYKRIVKEHGNACPILWVIKESCKFYRQNFISQDIKNLVA